MKTKLLVLKLIISALITGSVLAFYIYSVRPIKVYDSTLRADTTYINLENAKIKSVSELIKTLTPFKRLKSLDLGDFPVPPEDEELLISSFPNAEINYKCCVYFKGDMITANETNLDFSSKKLSEKETDELLEVLKRLPKIKEVNLRGNLVSYELQKKLVKVFPDIDFHWDISLLGETYDSDTTELNLSGNKEATPELILEYAPLFSKLRRIDMSDCGATNEEMAVLREALPDIKIVWRIHMGKWSLKTDAVAFSVLIYDYSHTRLKSEDIEVLKYCTDLQALDLGHQAITDISVLGDYLPQLRLLILADNQVSDLTPIAKMKHLHYIELFVNSRKLTDLSPLSECKELVDVNVSYLHNVKDISPLYELPMLERVWFEHTPIPAQQVKILKEKHPDTTIITEGTGSIDKGWRTHERYFAMIGMFHDKDCKELSESFSKYDR